MATGAEVGSATGNYHVYIICVRSKTLLNLILLNTLFRGKDNVAFFKSTYILEQTAILFCQIIVLLAAMCVEKYC